MGSKVATKGLGFLYNVTMGPYLGGYLGQDKPGDRSSSHISPTLFTSDDQVVLALGAAGGNKIPIAINQVAYRYLKQKFRLYDALVMPRTYMYDRNSVVAKQSRFISQNSKKWEKMCRKGQGVIPQCLIINMVPLEQ